MPARVPAALLMGAKKGAPDDGLCSGTFWRSEGAREVSGHGRSGFSLRASPIPFGCNVLARRVWMHTCPAQPASESEVFCFDTISVGRGR